MDAQRLAFLAEYSKSNRALCQVCMEKIDKGVLRLAAMVQSPVHDSKIPQWYHEDCFFKKQLPKSESEVAHFEALRYEDQKKIRDAIALFAQGVVPAAGGSKAKGKKRSAGEALSLKDYGVEYAASGRAMCRGCEIKILKDEVRIKKVSYDTEVGMKYGDQPNWFHAECFAKLRSELGYFEKAEVLPGFGSIKPDDQAKLKQLLPAFNADDVPTKKIKEEVKDEVDKAKNDEEEKQLAKQQAAFYKIRDKLKSLGVKKKELIEILEHNKQDVPEGAEAVLDRVCDIILFGALERCKKCGGQYVLQKSAYVCIGDLTDWVKCLNEEKAPPRKKTKIPTALKKAYSFLKDYKPVVKNRAIRSVSPQDGDENGTRTVIKTLNDGEQLPLYDLEFVILGETPTPKDQLKLKIQNLGGKVVTEIASHTAAVFSTPEEVEKMGARMLEAKEMQIQVVPEEFIECAQEGNALSFITSQSICDWGSDPQTRIFYHVPATVKLQLKSGHVVDPASGLADKAHVFKEHDVIYNCVLNKVDIQQDKNSYYKLQVLEADQGKKYWLFRSWGRIGTTIGGTKVESFKTSYDAMTAFEDLFEEKTGHEWERHDSRYQKHPGMLFPIEIDFSDMKRLAEENKIKSKLAPSVQDLIRMLFDVDAMNRVMLEFELDMEKMPLGKLSQRQLQSAMKILSEISDLIGSGGTNAQFIDASNRFYSFIPHNFGISAPKILDTLEQVKEKQTMLESLLEIEFAYSLLNLGEANVKTTLDVHYEQLKTDIETLERKSEEFAILEHLSDDDFVPAKKTKLESKTMVDGSVPATQEEQIAEQQKAYYKLRDRLKAFNIDKLDLARALRHNDQNVPSGLDAILDQLCDVMMFGALERCPNCGGQFEFQETAYVCGGNLTKWTKCLNKVTVPLRRKTEISDDLKKKYMIFREYDCVLGNRIIRQMTQVPFNREKSIKERNKAKQPPLANMEFVIIGKPAKTEKQLTAKILQMGGKVVQEITKHTTAIISTKAEVQRMSSRMQEAKDLQIQVVPEKFIESATGGDVLSLITSQAICDWGSDPHTRSPSKSEAVKSLPSKMKFQMKSGLIVDPDSGLTEQAHVYKKGDVIYNCVLNLVDIQRDLNSYYKIQVLEEDNKEK
ncbi:AGAP003230-PA-like protein [Anopheles sinensis]|uniref:NAD(+) ADP-ribosyltransferase n=1 Tax=Anopheles sinensis TaxID=74873 RepID=A0A084WSM4_ANOSI|nr:AGAP003230-PA-like protein [Anopheles sinensis]